MAQFLKVKAKMSKDMKRILIAIFAITVLAIITSSCTEALKRNVKNAKSNFTGGLERTLVLMDYTGDTIKVWSGKFDIRDNGADNQLFFDLDGKRVWIQGGIVVTEEI